jgi:hypothetical protein
MGIYKNQKIKGNELNTACRPVRNSTCGVSVKVRSLFIVMYTIYGVNITGIVTSTNDILKKVRTTIHTYIQRT